METEGKELALACARAAEEIQAEDIRLWDLRGLSSLTDFMVVCSGSSMPHLRAILRDGETGRVVPPEDPSALAVVLAELLADPAERARLGRNARAWAREHSTADRMARGYAEVLTEVAQPR